jgi:hypothetical protein
VNDNPKLHFSTEFLIHVSLSNNNLISLFQIHSVVQMIQGLLSNKGKLYISTIACLS